MDLLILFIRGQRVMLDGDLARVYAVPPGADDFMFQLTADEATSLRCQTGILKTGRGQHRKYRPHAFTEQGVAMLSSVLRSRRAVLVNVQIMRAFVAARREAGRYEALGRKLAELERTQKLQGEDIQVIFDALRQLEATTSWAYPEGRRLVGFRQGGATQAKRPK